MGVRGPETGEELLIDGNEATNLAEILGEQEAPAPTEEATPVGDVKTAEAAPPTDSGSDELTEEQLEALPPAEKAHYTGMKAERVKRQEAETNVTALNQQIQQQAGQVQQLMEMLKQTKQAPADPAEVVSTEQKSFWDDPEAFIRRQFEDVTGKLTESQQSQQTQRLEVSEMIAKSMHPDYEAQYQVFANAAKVNPALVKQIVASSNPAEAAYQYGKQQSEMSKIQEVGGVDALREQIKAELLAELGGDGTAQEAEKAIIAALPRPMASKRSAGAGMAPDTFAGDTPLGDLVG